MVGQSQLLTSGQKSQGLTAYSVHFPSDKAKKSKCQREKHIKSIIENQAEI
jgi:hypothetical protein